LVGNEVFILTTTTTTRLAGIGDHAVPGPKINSKMQYVAKNVLEYIWFISVQDYGIACIPKDMRLLKSIFTFKKQLKTYFFRIAYDIA
jgi:hypothetical protein